MPVPESSEYSTNYLKSARTLLTGLSQDLRAAWIEIEGELTTDPNKYPARLIQLDENTFVYRHPQPKIEITYRIDREKKILHFLHFVAPTLDVRKTLFISYSHEDEKWLLELKKWLQPLERRDVVTIWDDHKIKASADWRREIEKALASATAAVLLISMDFLNSDFIANHELPQLLTAAKDKGLQIFWIAVRESTVEDTDIQNYQAAHKGPPLASLDEAAREGHYKRIYKQIKEAVEAGAH